MKKQIDLYRGQLLPWHETILNKWDKYPYKIISVGRKGRKTTFDVNELFYHAMSDSRGLTYPFIGPTRTQAKEIVWDDHVKNILDVCANNEMEFKVNNSELSVRFPGYGKFVVDGADNIDSLRGKSDWGGGVADEFASWKNKKYAWEEVIEPNLSVHEAWFIISGTPKGYEYFHRLMKQGDHEGKIEGEAFDEDGIIVKPDPDFCSFRFESYDNPFLSRRFLEAKKRRLTIASFNQEYRARFEKYTGNIYKDFSRDIHVIPQFVPNNSWTFYRAMDFGATNPTVCLWIAVDHDENIYIFDEYYNSGERIEFHAGIINAKTKNVITATFGDPSGEQAILDYAGYGVNITPALKVYTADKNWVLSGIDKVQEKLKVNSLTKKPKLFITQNCQNLIREMEVYRWAETKTGDLIKEQPDKKDDHASDALRYFVVSYSPQDKTFSNDIYDDMNVNTNVFTGY